MNTIPQQPRDDKGDRRLEEILSRVKYTGPEPMPSIADLTADVSYSIHDIRRNRDNKRGQQR